MKTPDVSVVIPVYNRPVAICEAVASVFEQRGVDVEVIVVDDGSTDATPDALRELVAAGNQRLVVTRRDNGGPAAARNAGVALVSAPLVTFLDSDDLMEPGRLRLQIDVWSNEPGDAVVFGHERVEIAPGVAPPAHIVVRVEGGTTEYHTSVLLSRQQFDNVGGFDESMRLGEDADLILRLRDAGYRIVVVDEVLLVRRVLGDNLVYDPNAGRTMLALARRRAQRHRETREA